MFPYKIIFVFVLFRINTAIISVQSPIKIIDQPTNIAGRYNLYAHGSSNSDELKLSVEPLMRTGPSHFQHLSKICLEITSLNYKYRICPFENCTQHEQSIRWNPYRGVLGVYSGWLVENNTFEAMIFQQGDRCGDKRRKLMLRFRCNDANETDILSSVEESDTCEYSVTMVTPLVCHPQSMLVYPTLSEQGRGRWDELFTKYHDLEFTEKGYSTALHELMKSESLVPGGEYSLVADAAPTNLLEADDFTMNYVEHFTSLDHCQTEYRNLRSVIENLQRIILRNKQP